MPDIGTPASFELVWYHKIRKHNYVVLWVLALKWVLNSHYSLIVHNQAITFIALSNWTTWIENSSKNTAQHLNNIFHKRSILHRHTMLCFRCVAQKNWRV